MAQSNLTAVEIALQRAVPGWRAIAADPQWIRWLNAANPATGQLRQQLLDDAIEQGNVRVVVATLQRFQQEMREGWPIREIGQEMPPRAAVASYSRSEIAKNYARHQRGEITGAAWHRLKRDTIAAAREGRVANRACHRRTEGPRGCTLCLCRRAHQRQWGSYRHHGACQAAADARLYEGVC
jgi:hypothetical protein